MGQSEAAEVQELLPASGRAAQPGSQQDQESDGVRAGGRRAAGSQPLVLSSVKLLYRYSYVYIIIIEKYWTRRWEMMNFSEAQFQLWKMKFKGKTQAG